MYNVYFKERGVEIVPKSEGDIVEEPIWMLFKIFGNSHLPPGISPFVDGKIVVENHGDDGTEFKVTCAVRGCGHVVTRGDLYCRNCGEKINLMTVNVEEKGDGNSIDG